MKKQQPDGMSHRVGNRGGAEPQPVSSGVVQEHTTELDPPGPGGWPQGSISAQGGGGGL